MFTYRISALSEIAKANISVEQMQGMRNWIQENAKAGLTIGDCGELTRMYCRPVLDLHLETIRELIGKSYPEFSISVDGTPNFAGAECIMVRFVTNKLDIVELVARVGLFEKKLDSDNLANHILKCLNIRLSLPLCNWVSTQLDRANTNKAALRKIKGLYKDASPKDMFCISHGINNVGKKLLECLKKRQSISKAFSSCCPICRKSERQM